MEAPQENQYIENNNQGNINNNPQDMNLNNQDNLANNNYDNNNINNNNFPNNIHNFNNPNQNNPGQENLGQNPQEIPPQSPSGEEGGGNLPCINDMINRSEEDNEYSIHIAVIGKRKSGKSSLIRCFLNQSFSTEKKNTILDMFAKKININGQQIKILISELSQEKNDIELSKEVLKNSNIVFICYSLEDNTKIFFEELKEGKINFLNDLNKESKIFIVGCKFDLVKEDNLRNMRIVNSRGGYTNNGKGIKELFEENKFSGSYVTSALLNIGVERLFHDAIKIYILPYVYSMYKNKYDEQVRKIRTGSEHDEDLVNELKRINEEGCFIV